MPLVWAHAEYLKLCRSIEDGKVFDMPQPTVERYLENSSEAELFDWTLNNKFTWIRHGLILRISLFGPAKVIWTPDQWKSKNEGVTIDSGIGMHFIDIPTDGMEKGTTIEFTMYWAVKQKWEGNNFSVIIV